MPQPVLAVAWPSTTPSVLSIPSAVVPSLLCGRTRGGSGVYWAALPRSERPAVGGGKKHFMVRYLGWLANTALFTLCCFLVANTANAIIAALLSQSPALAVDLGPRSGPRSRTWDDRQQITQRNLFHSAKLSAAASTPTAPTDEELKETELPLKLWGTIAADDPALSWASVEEMGTKGAIMAVRVGDKIQTATVVGIERRRVVLLENGSRRSLTLDDDDVETSLATNLKRSKPRTKSTKSRTRTSVWRRSRPRKDWLRLQRPN